MGGQGARQARPVGLSSAGGAGCQAGEDGQAIMCVSWGGGGQYAGQARLAGHYVLGGGGVVRLSGEACQATMCWGSGAPIRRGRQAIMCIVRRSYLSSYPHFLSTPLRGV